MTMDGVSVIICCYNSSTRLPDTLSHLRRQKVRRTIPWEVVIVDNASTDNTTVVARQCWPSDAPTVLRVVYEPRLGLIHARWRGFSEASYDVVSFVDDDNWVCSDWIELVSEIMNQYPEVGACGGRTEAVCEIPPPFWFERYKRHYAIGAQSDEAGDISQQKGALWGAGLTIRKTAWQQLLDHGFQPLLIGRQGANLSTGEDGELSRALHLVGWGLWYDPRLQLQHYLSANRFEWGYLRRLCRGDGAASVFWDLYRYALSGDPRTFKERLKRTWQWKIFAALTKTLLYGGKACFSHEFGREGNPDILVLESIVGRLSELLRARKTYRRTFNKERLNRLSQGYFFT